MSVQAPAQIRTEGRGGQRPHEAGEIVHVVGEPGDVHDAGVESLGAREGGVASRR
jgi:hypothetical protein